MKVNILATILLLISIVSNAQQSEIQNPWTLKLAPTSLLNPINPAIHLAIDYELKNGIHIQPEFGLLLKHHLLDTTNNTFGWRDFDSENKGFFVKLDIRKNDFILKKPFYLAAHVFYLYNNYKRYDDRFDATPELTGGSQFCSTCIVESEYSIKKNLFGFKVKLGYEKVFAGGLVIDAYFGVGLSIRDNKHSVNTELHENPAIADKIQFGLFPRPNYYMPHFPGVQIGPYLGFLPGLKIGYKF